MNKLLIKRLIVIFILISFLSLEGCEAFRRKFVRKPKKKKEIEEEIILEPQEYPEIIYDNATLYKKFYTFWKSSHAELIISLAQEQSYKKQLYYFDEVTKNLQEMKNLLTGQKQEEVAFYIQEILKQKDSLSSSKLKDAILSQLKSKLIRIEKKIRVDFNYKKIKDWIIKE